MQKSAFIGIALIAHVPALHLILSLGAAWLAWRACGWGLALIAMLAAIYIVPPLLSRLALAINGPLPARCSTGSRPFLVWWYVLSLQVIFTRFSFFEEVLRLVPALYSAWLRLWGAQIGRFVRWGARIDIPDRPFVNIGDSALIGHGARIFAHYVSQDDDGHRELWLGRPTIGANAIMGAFSGLVCDASIAPGEVLPATVGLGPGMCWKDGRRHRPPQDDPDHSAMPNSRL